MIPVFILAIEDENDREFMTELYLHYNRLMYSTIIKIVHDPSTTEDLLQNVLLKFIDKIQDLRTKDRDHLINYVIAACRNHALNYLRDHGRHEIVYLDGINDLAEPSRQDSRIEEIIINQERFDLLAKVWGQLDEHNRILLESYYVLEKSMPEIADELGIKPASVRMALSRARSAARKAMEKCDVECPI